MNTSVSPSRHTDRARSSQATAAQRALRNQQRTTAPGQSRRCNDSLNVHGKPLRLWKTRFTTFIAGGWGGTSILVLARPSAAVRRSVTVGHGGAERVGDPAHRSRGALRHSLCRFQQPSGRGSKGDPVLVRTKDFKDKQLGKVTPTGSIHRARRGLRQRRKVGVVATPPPSSRCNVGGRHHDLTTQPPDASGRVAGTRTDTPRTRTSHEVRSWWRNHRRRWRLPLLERGPRRSHGREVPSPRL